MDALPAADAAHSPLPSKEDPESLVLRGRPRPVVRFRRGLIVGVAGAVGAGLIAIAWTALEPPGFRLAEDETPGEPFSAAPPAALADAPTSYGDVPKLGPPLPGDLGRPILDHRRSLDPSSPGVPVTDGAEAAAEAERRRAAEARQAARASDVMVRLAATDNRAGPTPASTGHSMGDSLADGVHAAPEVAKAQRKAVFAGLAGGDVNPHALRPAPSPWTLSAGTVIPASLITGLNSDLPGLVIAQVTDHVSDSVTGRTVLIPQGARLIGTYDSDVGHGQRRAMLVWQRIIFPDGSSIRLDDMPASDSAGVAGVEDRVNFHTGRLIKGIALSTLLGVGTELGFGGGESELVRALRESTQENAARAGDRLASKNLDVRPTLTIRPGWPVRAIVHKDLVLRPWKG